MSSYTYPGVYVQEIPSAVHTISGVATSIAAFVGTAPQGPTTEATQVLSWSQYERIFGGLYAGSALGYAVNQFFTNGGQQAYIVRLVDGATAANNSVSKIDYAQDTGVTTFTTGSGLEISANNPGSWGKNLSVTFQPRPDDLTRFTLTVIQTDPVTSVATPVEVFSNLSFDSTDSSGLYIVNVLQENSNYVTATITGTMAIETTGTATSPPQAPQASTGLALSSDGSDGTAIAPTTSGSPGTFEGYLDVGATMQDQLDRVPLFNLLIVPGEYDGSTISKLEDYVVTKRAFLIVDCPPDAKVSSTNFPDSLITGANGTNAAIYFPWVNAYDPITQTTHAFPPSGFVAGIYAATDASRQVWKAPAGINASLTGQAGLATILTDAENGVLNPNAVNCLRHFQVYGDVVWGARTLRGNDQIGSEWKYINVRRLALFLETSLYQGTQWVVFEPNDETLWGQIRLNVGSFMQGLYLQGAFQGTSPDQAYFVKCDADNNPNTASGVVNVMIGFAPVNPAEFVILQLTQFAGQS